MRTVSEGRGVIEGAVGEELRWKEDWKVAGCKVRQRQVAVGVGHQRVGMAAGRAGGVKPRDPVPQNPLCAGFEARAFADRE